MKKGLLTFILTAYSAILIRLLVFKNNWLMIGRLRLKFAQKTGQANFLPFKNIISFLRGDHGWTIGILNLVGNIVLFVPIGFLVPFIYPQTTWQKSIILALAFPLIIEGMQLTLRVGIFDIDDVILNALGVIIGYGLYTILFKKRDAS